MKRVARLVGIVAVCLAAALAGIAPASANPRVDYVALGDSFSAGTGAITQLGDYLDLTDGCLRSTHAYPRQIAAAQGWNLQHRACQGASTADVAGQLTALNSATDVVTITIGGNDIGFIPVILACSTPGTTKGCLKTLLASQAAMVLQLPSALKKVYSAIKQAAPNARIVAVGYPRLFSGTDCSPDTDYTPTEQVAMNIATDVLNASIATTAARSGIEFVNPTRAFRGHAWCDKKAWVNGPAFTAPLPFNAGSMHPNVAGQTAYATVVAKGLKH